ncbi:Brix domain-containing protein [Kalaharituber pfeilii]|nr:Brix domain-containing protein [Kalaharituber pfeilii]
MARRRTKKRTHPKSARKGAIGEQPLNAHLNSNKIPKSMVIRIGASEVGPSISRLVLDTRKMMEPHTAIRLKERKGNKLRDYTTMAGPLGVTQLLLFSRNSESGSTTLRIARCPRGPTLHFRIKKYSLCKDIRRSMKRPKTPTKEYLSPPLLVMNNFTTAPPSDHPTCTPHRPPPHEALIISMFQSLFPAISAQRTPISSIRRVLLLNRIPKASVKDLPEDERSASDYLIDLRHYMITTKPVGLSRAIRRLNAAERIISKSSSPAPRGKGVVPNLGKLEDISEYMLDPNAAATGYTSESEVEDDAEVEVLPGSSAAKNPTKRKCVTVSGGAEKRAVKLTEIGPRMTLELVKIEEGLADGKVLYHSFIKKSKKEERELDQRWQERLREKERRRKEQEENIRRKKGEKGKKNDDGGQDKDEDELIDYIKDQDDEMWDDENDDENEHEDGKGSDNEMDEDAD